MNLADFKIHAYYATYEVFPSLDFDILKLQHFDTDCLDEETTQIVNDVLNLAADNDFYAEGLTQSLRPIRRLHPFHSESASKYHDVQGRPNIIIVGSLASSRVCLFLGILATRPPPNLPNKQVDHNSWDGCFFRVTHLLVDAAFRGRQVGSALFLLVLDAISRMFPHKNIHMELQYKSDAAKAFWKTFGFEPSKFRSEERLPENWMTKIIPADPVSEIVNVTFRRTTRRSDT